jgi:hypothetical protein
MLDGAEEEKEEEEEEEKEEEEEGEEEEEEEATCPYVVNVGEGGKGKGGEGGAQTVTEDWDREPEISKRPAEAIEGLRYPLLLKKNQQAQNTARKLPTRYLV